MRAACAGRHGRALPCPCSAARARDRPFLARRSRPEDLAQATPDPADAQPAVRMLSGLIPPLHAVHRGPDLLALPAVLVLSALALPCGTQGRRGAAVHMASAAALTIFKLSGPFSRQAARRRGRRPARAPVHAAPPSGASTHGHQILHSGRMCLRSKAGLAAPAARGATIVMRTLSVASQSRPCRACRPPGTGRRLPGPPCRRKSDALSPTAALRRSRHFWGRGKSAGRVRHCILPGAPICPAAWEGPPFGSCGRRAAPSPPPQARYREPPRAPSYFSRAVAGAPCR